MTDTRSLVRVLEPTDVWLHGAAALGVGLALATAPLLHLAPSFPILLPLAPAPGRLHALGALVAAGAWGLHAVRVCLAWLGGRSPWGLLPRLGDGRDLADALRFGAGLSAKRPVPGRFSYRERLPYAAALVLLPVLAVTGWVAAHPGAACGVLGARGVYAFASVHAGAGALVVPVLLWHLYFALLQPGALSSGSVFLTGRSSWERLARTRPGWARELSAAQELPTAGEASETVSVEEWLADGNLCARDGDYAGAEEAYVRALELYPGYSQALFNLGVARWKGGKLEGARETLSLFRKRPINPFCSARQGGERLRQS